MMNKSRHWKHIKRLAQLVNNRTNKKIYIQYDATFSPHSWNIDIDGYAMFNANMTGPELSYYLRGMLQGADFMQGYEL